MTLTPDQLQQWRALAAKMTHAGVWTIEELDRRKREYEATAAAAFPALLAEVERTHAALDELRRECNAGIDGGCGACELCDPMWWKALADKDTARAAAQRDSAIADRDRLREALKEALRGWSGQLYSGGRLRDDPRTMGDVDRIAELRKLVPNE